MTDGADYIESEIIPASVVSKLTEEEFSDLFNELLDSANQKASWTDGEDAFDEEDARASHHQKWDSIDSDLDKRGI